MATAKLAAIGLGAILGSLAMAGPAAAQEDVPQCGGLDATIVHLVTDPSPIDENGLWWLSGTDGDDVIVVHFASEEDAYNSPYYVDGGPGDDTICTHSDERSEFFAIGGEGNDTIFTAGTSWGHFRFNTAIGGPGDDILHGGPNGDLLIGEDGNDAIYSYQGDDMIGGDSGSDTISAGRGVDFVSGGSGDDTVLGGPDDDYLYGGEGRDTLFGGSGHDQLFSNDDFTGFAESQFEPVTWDNPPPGVIGNGTPTSFSLDTAGSRMFGGSGSDLLVGSNRWDRMQGGPGDDFMLGMEGRDWMRGGAGDDVIIGGLGIDDINGNLGADEILVQAQDSGTGGYGTDTCLDADTPRIKLTSCESTGEVGAEWDDLSGRLNEARFEIETSLRWSSSLRSTGTCISVDAAADRPLSAIGCEQPHDYEVYRQIIPPASITEYSRTALTAHAEEVCRLSLAAYLPPEDDRDLQFTSVIPSRRNWVGYLDEPDRLLTCLLSTADGTPLVGRAA